MQYKKFIKKKESIHTIECRFEWDQLNTLYNAEQRKEVPSNRLYITIDFKFFKMLGFCIFDDKNKITHIIYSYQHDFFNNSKDSQMNKNHVLDRIKEAQEDGGLCDLVAREAQTYLEQCMNSINQESFITDENNNLIVSPFADNLRYFEINLKTDKWQKIA